MVTAVTGSTSTSSTTSTTSVQAQQDRFLKLLVTQMKNQDPLNPMDNAEITSQMAQLSTVTGIEKLNETLAAFRERHIDIAYGPFPARPNQRANVIVRDDAGNMIQVFGR